MRSLLRGFYRIRVETVAVANKSFVSELKLKGGMRTYKPSEKLIIHSLCPNILHRSPIPVRIQPDMRNMRRPLEILCPDIESKPPRLGNMLLYGPLLHHFIRIRINVQPGGLLVCPRQYLRSIKSLPHLVENWPLLSYQCDGEQHIVNDSEWDGHQSSEEERADWGQECCEGWTQF